MISEQIPNQDASEAISYAEQDQTIAELINAVLQVITQIRNDQQISDVLATVGYGEEQLNEGILLCEAAQRGFDRRQAALNTRIDITGQLEQARDELNKDFSDFRVVARAMFEESEDRRKLGVSGRRPDDLQKLLTVASAAFHAGAEDPYAGILSRHGFDSSRLTELEGQIEAVRQLAADQNTATNTAVEATRIRDEAADELSSWASKLRAVAKRHLREVPNALMVLEAS